MPTPTGLDALAHLSHLRAAIASLPDTDLTLRTLLGVLLDGYCGDGERIYTMPLGGSGGALDLGELWRIGRRGAQVEADRQAWLAGIRHYCPRCDKHCTPGHVCTASVHWYDDRTPRQVEIDEAIASGYEPGEV